MYINWRMLICSLESKKNRWSLFFFLPVWLKSKLYYNIFDFVHQLSSYWRRITTSSLWTAPCHSLGWVKTRQRPRLTTFCIMSHQLSTNSEKRYIWIFRLKITTISNEKNKLHKHDFFFWLICSFNNYYHKFVFTSGTGEETKRRKSSSKSMGTEASAWFFPASSQTSCSRRRRDRTVCSNDADWGADDHDRSRADSQPGTTTSQYHPSRTVFTTCVPNYRAA